MINRLKKLVLNLIIAGAGFIYAFWPSPYPVWPKKAIVVGASSGIGKAIAQELSKNGYQVGLIARREELLYDLHKLLPNKSYIKKIDIAKTDDAMIKFQDLIKQMGGVSLVVLNAAVGFDDTRRVWFEQEQMIEVNTLGFASMAHCALDHFIQQKKGHLVGITSISGLRGTANAFTYCATKSFQSTLLEGIRNTSQLKNLGIYVTDIKPGFVDTDMVKGRSDKFWEASPDEAARQIYDAIKAKKKIAYVTKRWRLIAWFFKFAPDWLFNSKWVR